jgi:hypothetical protein
MRRLAFRPILLVVLVVAAMVLGACSDDSGSKNAKPKQTTAPASSTSPAPGGSTPLTLNADPAECLRGTFRFTRMDYDGPVQTQFGPTTIKGGIAGRRIELKRDNSFHFTDDGRERVQFSVQNPSGTTNGTAVLKAQADGTYVPTTKTASFNITALSGSLIATLQDGSNIDIPLPPDGTGVKETFGLNGEGNYTCEGNAVTVRFAALTIVLERV